MKPAWSYEEIPKGPTLAQTTLAQTTIAQTTIAQTTIADGVAQGPQPDDQLFREAPNAKTS